MTEAALQGILSTAPILGAMLLLAALGGWLSERGGVVNIGLEGMMLSAACAAYLVGIRSGPVAGVFAAIVTATALSLIHWTGTQRLRIDPVVSGMAINLVASGGTAFVYDQYPAPGSAAAPHFGTLPFVVLAFALTLALAWVARHTRSGLRLIAVGADPDKARLMGIRPPRVRLQALVGTGIMTGLAGTLVFAYSGTFTKDMIAGRGYIALAALILGGWRPIPTALVCLAFGTFSSFQVALQGRTILGVTPPSQVWAAIPYVVTVIALAGLLGRNRTPAGLGRP